MPDPPEDEPLRERRGWLLEQYRELFAAVRFLSVLPLPGEARLFRSDETNPRLVLGSGYFSFVGIVLALLLLILVYLLGPLLPPLALAAVLVVAASLLTGGLHLDGLMDTCDGVFGGRSPEQRLEIMRDSRVGSFGVLGGVSVLLLKFAFFASLDRQTLGIGLLSIWPTARWVLVLVMRMFPPARRTGLGATFRQTVSWPRLLCCGLLALLVAGFSGHLPGLLIWAVMTLAALAIAWGLTRKLGGLTGDTYGAIAEVVEVLGLFTLLLLRT
ncbi:MAG TPA: adenosylcobinamide-GDP ribazoletransferase [Ktedonobacteraceae bacterium]|nr:adenosylcobinamide-GDP ribazoletransferase [Ktedonobacteraceae bacterium]